MGFVRPDAGKKPPRELPTPTATLGPEAWAALAEQVQGAAPGARECFVALVLVVAHADAAKDFLERIRADDDASGTGAAAYPLGATMFEHLLRRLPEQDTDRWAKSIRAELQAGQRLASGLRALCERRNLAAAGHLDKLLADHPHSYVVAVLP